MNLSTSRIGWIVGLVVMTIGYLMVLWRGYSYAEATVVYGGFVTGLKGWEKFLGYKYGVKDASQDSK